MRGAAVAAVSWLPLQVCRFINFQHEELDSEVSRSNQTKTMGAVASFSASYKFVFFWKRHSVYCEVAIFMHFGLKQGSTNSCMQWSSIKIQQGLPKEIFFSSKSPEYINI